MIATPLPAFTGTGPTRVWLACGATDMRKGFDGLAVLVQQVLRQDPHSGALFAFRGKRGDLVKLLWYDGQGLCLFSKRMDRGPVRLADHRDRDRGAQRRAALDAIGGHRLAASGTGLEAVARGLINGGLAAVLLA